MYKWYNVDSLFLTISELVSFQLLIYAPTSFRTPAPVSTLSTIDGYKSPLTSADMAHLAQQIGFQFADLIPFMTTTLPPSARA